MSRLLTYGVMQQRRKVTLGFEPFVAPADFDRTAQPVDIFAVYSSYYAWDKNARYIYSFTSAIATLSLSAVSGISYRWGETISGTDYVYDVSSGTAFTAASTNRYVIVNNTSNSFAVVIPTGAIWLYLGDLTVTSFGCQSTLSPYYLNYIHSHDLSNILSISAVAFRNQKELTGNLTIPDQLTSLPNWCFSDCDKITGEIKFPDGMTSVGGSWAFYGCGGITSVDLNNITDIGSVTFDSCTGLTSINLRNVVTINVQAFRGCTNITGALIIPDSCTTIGGAAFKQCSKLTSITFQTNASFTTIGYQAFMLCPLLAGTLTIPTSVTDIQYEAFSDCTGFTGTLTIPSSILSIGYGCFHNCTGFSGQLTIPSNVTAIGEYAFANDNFTPIVNNASNFIIDDHVLYDITDSPTAIIAIHSEKSYSGTLTFRTGTTRIGSYCFQNNSRTGSFTILSSTTSLGAYILTGCTGFTGNLTIPDAVTTIQQYCLINIGGTLGNLTFGTGVPDLPNYVCANSDGFKGTLTLPSNCTTVGYMAFEGSDGFTGDLTIPSTCTITQSRNFRNRSWDTGTLTINNTNPSLVNNTFDGCKFDTLILCANYIGTATAYGLYFALCTYLSGSSLDAAWRNIVPGTSGAWKTFTIGATNKARLLAYNANAETEAAANYLYIV